MTMVERSRILKPKRRLPLPESPGRGNPIDIKSGLRRLYQDLLRMRLEWPALRNYSQRSARLLPTADLVLELTRGKPGADSQSSIRALFNLSPQEQPIPDEARGRMRWSSEEERYHGARRAHSSDRKLLPYECLVLESSSLVVREAWFKA